MPAPTMTIKGRPATGIQAELHFVEWVLALSQENDAELEIACHPHGRTSLTAMKLFQDGVYRIQAGTCRHLVERSGIRFH